MVAVRAREFAIKHHADQVYGIHPYIVHLDAVADLVRVYGDIAVSLRIYTISLKTRTLHWVI